jgi:Zn-dependent protease with chaperone function
VKRYRPLGVLGFLGACVLVPPLADCGTVECAAGRGIAAPALIVLAGGAAWVLALLSLGVRDAVRSRRRVAALGLVSSDVVDQACLAIGAAPVGCLDTDELIAVCAGAWSPAVFVSRGLAESLSGEELTPVLLHQQVHRRRRDPLRRALRHRFTQAVFFIPLVGWWEERARTAEEIAADAAALRHCGPRPLARALLIAGGGGHVDAAAAFGGSAGLRIRKLAGDRVSLGVPSLMVCTQSFLGATIAAAALMCFAGIPSGV